MIKAAIRSFPALCVASGLFFVLAGPAPARAADASAWDGDSRSAARLIAGKSAPGASGPTLRAGVELRLAEGWKTYWRYPGDSGVPPQFDFSASENVKSIALRWPAPQLFAEADGATIGYKHNVIFPLRIIAADSGKPVVLRLKLGYAVCDRLCIPAEAQGELTLAVGLDSANDDALRAAEARVPIAAALGAAGPLSIRAVRREAGATPARILVEVAADAGKVELFVEGPSPDWALPVPEPISGGGAGLQRFAFTLDGLPPGAKPDGARLTITAVTPKDAIETTFRLD